MFHGDPVPVTPLIGKLRLHVQNYTDYEDFFVSPLKHHDVVLGIPWFHCHRVQLSFPDMVFQFVHRGRMHKIIAKSRVETISVVSYKSFSKEIKSARNQLVVLSLLLCVEVSC